MKNLLLAALLCLPAAALCQSGITFKVEELSRPAELLKEDSPIEIFQEFIRNEAGERVYDLGKDYQYQYNIITQGNLPESLVGYGYQPFFYGMQRAYAEHRPYVISPDVIWMVICRGFSMHMNANAEQLHRHFMEFSGRITVVPQANSLSLDNPMVAWDEIIAEAIDQIGLHTNYGLIKTLTADFSTTTANERLASQVLIMHATQKYFDISIGNPLCGIPEITLQGTPADWRRVLEKTKQLSKYDLEWWTKELEPLLNEFIETSKGNINTQFWRDMYKIHTPESCGPRTINGWIVKFYPYNQHGEKRDLGAIVGPPNLPDEIVKVELTLIDERTKSIIPLELWAGIVGLQQNKETFALAPKIGWMLRKANSANDSRISEDNPVTLRVLEIPKVLLRFSEIDNLKIEFIDRISIYHISELVPVKIRKLTLVGETNEKDIQHIRSLFPNTQLEIQNTRPEKTTPTDEIKHN